MEKLKIIAVKDLKNGGYTGFLKDKPNVISEGNDVIDLVKNMIELSNVVKEHENKIIK